MLGLFDGLLLRNIDVLIQNSKGDVKPIRSGKLVSTAVKNNVLKLKISENNIVKDVEVFYPFDLERIKDDFVFDYTLRTLCTDNIYLKAIINSKRTVETLPAFNCKIIIKKI